MSPTVGHETVHVPRAPDEVVAFLLDPANLPTWADGLGTVEQVDGTWRVAQPGGNASLRFVTRNDLGVADHWVTLPTGEEVHVPVRVLPHDSGSQVTFTVFRRPGGSDEDLAADRRAVAADLVRLRERLTPG